MSDRIASKSDEERQRLAGDVLASLPLHIRATNDRQSSAPKRHRHHRLDYSRSRASGPVEALDCVAASPSIVSAISSDGALSFTLCPRPRGVVVQRSELRPGKRRIVQSMLFANARAFVLWCESDQLRFAYPLLFSNLSRRGRDLFDSAG